MLPMLLSQACKVKLGSVYGRERQQAQPQRLRNKAAFLDDGLGENPRAMECCIMFGGH